MIGRWPFEIWNPIVHSKVDLETSIKRRHTSNDSCLMPLSKESWFGKWTVVVVPVPVFCFTFFGFGFGSGLGFGLRFARLPDDPFWVFSVDNPCRNLVEKIVSGGPAMHTVHGARCRVLRANQFLKIRVRDIQPEDAFTASTSKRERRSYCCCRGSKPC